MGTAQMQGPLWCARRRMTGTESGRSRSRPRSSRPPYDDTGRWRSGTRLLDAGCGSGLALVLADLRGARPSSISAPAPARTAASRARVGPTARSSARHDRGDALRGRQLRRRQAGIQRRVRQGLHERPHCAAARDQARRRPRRQPVAVTTGHGGAVRDAAVLGAIGGCSAAATWSPAATFALAARGALEGRVEDAGLTSERRSTSRRRTSRRRRDRGALALASGPARRRDTRPRTRATRAALARVCEVARRDDGR